MKRTLYPSLFDRYPKLGKAVLSLFLFAIVVWIATPFIAFQNKKVLFELEADYQKLIPPANTTLINYDTFYKPGTSLVRVDGKFQTSVSFSEIVDEYDAQLKSLGWVFLRQSDLDVNSRYYVLYCKGYWLTTKIEQEQSGYLISLNRGYDYDCASGNMNPWNAMSMLSCFSPFLIIGCVATWFSISGMRKKTLSDTDRTKHWWVLFVGLIWLIISITTIFFSAKSLIWYLFTK